MNVLVSAKKHDEGGEGLTFLIKGILVATLEASKTMKYYALVVAMSAIACAGVHNL